MNKRFLLILAVIVAVFVGLALVNRDDSGNNPSNSEEPQTTNHTFGESSSGVTFVEYGDFQCPACAGYYPVFSQLKQEYADRVTFQFRHFPLISIHQNAMAAHRAAEAAGNQDKFWEMHDLLYARQDAWSSSSNASGVFEDYAIELGLDVEKFKTDAASSQTNATINADFKAGQDLGVSGTPSFVINGKLIESPRPEIEAFRAVLDEALADQN